jgi:hypothetical protein
MTTTWTPSMRPDVDELREHSQKARVRDLLRSAGADGLCSLMVYAAHIPNGRNRVVELRDEDRLDIETVRCDLTKYHAGERAPGHVRWIFWWNGNPRQRRLLRDI